jgi:predicted SprT family Zn-dependent metalloprotease
MKQADKTFYIKRDRVWDTMCEFHPSLVRVNPPKIVINNRFTRTAGCCHQESGMVELGGKFIAKFPAQMYSIILPHEIMHYIDYVLYGESEFSHGHGKKWCKLMLEYGLPADRFHTLDIFAK